MDIHGTQTAVMALWLAGEIASPVDQRPPSIDESLNPDGYFVPTKACRMLASEKARAKRRATKEAILREAEKQGRNFVRLSEKGHSAQAKRISRARDKMPHVRIRTS